MSEKPRNYAPTLMRAAYIFYFVGIGLAVFLWREPSVGTARTATRALLVNRLIVAGDLSEPAWQVESKRGAAGQDNFIGKYTTSDVLQGQTLHPREVATTPLLGKSRVGVRVLLPIKVEHVIAGTLNAGEQGALCPAAPDKIAVLTVFCAHGIKEPCAAAVDLSIELVAKLGDKLKGGEVEMVPASLCK